MLADVPPWPEPSDLLTAILTWLRVPAEIVAVVVAVEWVYGWLQWLLGTLRTGARVVGGGRRLAGRWSASRGGSTLLLVPSGAVLVASSYSISQLVQLMGMPDASGRNLADGELFDWATQWRRLILADRWPEASQWAVWLPVAVLLAMGVAQIGQFRLLGGLIRVVVVTCTAAAAVFAVIVGVAGCAVIGDSLIPESGYNFGMASLYIAWTALLGGGVAGLRFASTLSRRAFG